MNRFLFLKNGKCLGFTLLGPDLEWKICLLNIIKLSHFQFDETNWIINIVLRSILNSTFSLLDDKIQQKGSNGRKLRQQILSEENKVV